MTQWVVSRDSCHWLVKRGFLEEEEEEKEEEDLRGLRPGGVGVGGEGRKREAQVCQGTVSRAFSGTKAKSGGDRRRAELVPEEAGEGEGDGEAAMPREAIRSWTENTNRGPTPRPIKLSPH